MNLLILILSCIALARSQSSDCENLKNVKIKMDVVASNIVNVETTRTPEGGPYLSRRVVCGKGFCTVQSENKIKLVYSPTHIDADRVGWVAYPAIDVAHEEIEMGKLVGDYEHALEVCSNLKE